MAYYDGRLGGLFRLGAGLVPHSRDRYRFGDYTHMIGDVLGTVAVCPRRIHFPRPV